MQVLWGGFVADPEYNDPITVAIRALNEHVSKDTRVDISMLNIGDGTTLVFKRWFPSDSNITKQAIVFDWSIILYETKSVFHLMISIMQTSSVTSRRDKHSFDSVRHKMHYGEKNTN